MVRHSKAQKLRALYTAAVERYTSKLDLYVDHDVSLKFAVAPPSRATPTHYRQLETALAEDFRYHVDDALKRVRNTGDGFPLASGFFLDQPAARTAGHAPGRAVILRHTSGPEIFLISRAAWEGPIGGVSYEDEVSKIVRDLVLALRDRWEHALRDEQRLRITHVDIRTADRGALRVHFAHFRTTQLRCLLDRFATVHHLRDRLERCFGEQGAEIESSRD